jgi:hemoglobin/transferrin/lactoferrin receptor protein
MMTGSLRLAAVFLFCAVRSISPDAILTGTVRDTSGAPVGKVSLQLRDAQSALVAAAASDLHGKFQFPVVDAGEYVLVLARSGRIERRLPVRIDSRSAATELEVVLDPLTRRESVTVTATLGLVESELQSAQSVTIVGRPEIDARAKTVLAQVANEETGVAWQRTSPTISGIFIRGLTGNKVNVCVDGVRYSTGAMRGGINTFLDLVDPSSVETVEILRGPSSAQYGSDALGGSIQFRSPAPFFAAGEWHGRFGTFFNSADVGYGSNAGLSYAKNRFGMVANLAAHRANTLRTGGARDSRSAVTRFLGLPSSFAFPVRAPDTAFTQYAGLARVYWILRGDSQVVAHYERSQQDGGKRFDQLLGGDGNLVADLRNLMLDFGYLRYSKARLGSFDNFSATYSVNIQREERVNQGGNGNPLAAITHEPERATAHGVQSGAGRQIGNRWNLYVGGEYYHEGVWAPSYAYNPAADVFSIRRGRVPDGARFRHGGIYGQNTMDLVPGLLRVTGNLRWNAASYRSRAADAPRAAGRPLWPDDSLTVNSVTFRAGAVAAPERRLSFAANISRGFRAPHITDLGTLGLTGAGFEVAAPDLAGLGGFVGSTAGADAVSTGRPVRQLQPESSLGYEGSIRYRSEPLAATGTFFINDISDNIAKQSLLLPPGSVGRLLGSEPIVAQNPNGAVFVGASSAPVLVRANFDRARVRGVELRLEGKPRRNWMYGVVGTYLNTRDKATGLAPNIEGGTPPLNGYFRLRYAPGSRRFWIEPFVHAADAQDRLSSLDLSDRRIGAARTSANIANFFNNGALVRGLVRGGLLLATRETLAQVQNRVLGTAASAPLYTRLAGYATFNLRAGWRIGERQDLVAEFENITDRNYRGISWGIDAPGRGFYLRYSVHF